MAGTTQGRKDSKANWDFGGRGSSTLGSFPNWTCPSRLTTFTLCKICSYFINLLVLDSFRYKGSTNPFQTIRNNNNSSFDIPEQNDEIFWHRPQYCARACFGLQIYKMLLSLRTLIHLSQLTSLRFFVIMSHRFISSESSHAFCLALELILLIITNYISW